jgi:hypothetical protein
MQQNMIITQEHVMIFATQSKEKWCRISVCFLALQSHPTSYITYILSWQLISAPELSHDQATNKNYKMEALYIIGSRSPPLHR